MKYHETTGKTIQQDFDRYHEEHPEVFVKFKEYLNELLIAEQTKRNITLEQIKLEKRLKTSSKMILNRIRWESTSVGILTGGSEEKVAKRVFDGFKINENFTSRYARLFCEQNPEWDFLFNFRKLKS